MTGWAGGIVEWRRRRRVAKLIRTLDPVLLKVSQRLPEIEFVTLEQDQCYRLYRQVIEFRDAQLLLQPYVHPALRDWVDEVLPDGPEATINCVYEAAALVTALDAFDRGLRLRQPATDDEELRERCRADFPDTITEARWLATVAGALDYKPVRRLRRRVAEDISNVVSG